MSWLAQKNTNFGSTEVEFFAIPGTDTLFIFYTDGPNGGSPNVKVQKSLDGGNTFAAAVTIATTVAGGDMALNDPIAYDPITGRLFASYGKSIDAGGGAKAVLAVRYSDDLGATWSAEHVIDDGTVHTSLNAFYRSGLWAYNGQFSVHYSYIDNSAFTSDGLWRMTATWTTGSAMTWGGIAKVYSAQSGVVMPSEPNVWGFTDGTVIVSWYDPGVVSNIGGDLWIARSLDSGATWDASATKITSSNDLGRPRLKGENGNWWIVANKPWPDASLQDTYSLTSTDNGVTWGAPTLRIAHNGSGNTSHPDVTIQDQFVGIIVGRVAGAVGHAFVFSTDGGATFSAESNPLSDAAGTSDAPRLLITNSYLVATGYDQTNTRSMWAMNPQWFAVQPTAQTSVIESGTGADENPLSAGGIFTQGSVIVGVVGTALQRLSNILRRNQTTTGFQRSASYYNAATFTGNVEVFVTQATLGGETNPSIGDPTTKNGYTLASLNNDFYSLNGLTLNRTDAGAGALLYGSGADGGSVAGDKICLQLVGTQVTVWQNRGGSWVEKFRGVDNTYRSSLRISLDLVGNVGVGDFATNFGGGSLVAPTSSVAPVISGSTTLGSTLTCGFGTWGKTPVRYAFQWKRDGVAISGATLPFYKSKVADVGHVVTCALTAYNAIGSTTAAASNSFTISDTFPGPIYEPNRGGIYGKRQSVKRAGFYCWGRLRSLLPERAFELA